MPSNPTIFSLPSNTPSRALVTGGAGFIGSHLAEALVRQGIHVTVLDDLSTGDLQNLSWGTSTPFLEVVQGSITDTALVRRCMAGCQWVFHQAAIASVPQSVAQPAATHRINLEATLDLLIAARDLGVRRFVFASSAAIYGDSEKELKHEADPVRPLTPYGLQKYTSERYAQLFHDLYGLETVSLRYFNVFGPRQRFDSPYSGAIARFCAAFLSGTPPTLFGDGLQSRDFACIADVVAANLLAAQRPAEEVAGKVFNIAGGQSVTLLDLVGHLREVSGSVLIPVHQPAREGDIRHSAADLNLARQHLHFTPAVAWKTGLLQTYQWYSSQR